MPVTDDTELDLEPFVATVEDDDHERSLTITVKSEPNAYADHTCGPMIHLDVEFTREEMAFATTYDLAEPEAQALIDALQQALARSREVATSRGYYEWIAAGKPDYNEPGINADREV